MISCGPEVRRHLENPALIVTAHARLQTEPIADDLVARDIRDLQKKLAEFDREEHRLLDAYQAGLIPLDQLGRRQELLRQRRAHVANSLEARHHDQAAVAETAQLHLNLDAFIRRINGPLATLSFEHQQQVVRTVVDRVMVEDGRIDIHFAIPVPNPPSAPTRLAHEPVSTFSRLRSHDGNGARTGRDDVSMAIRDILFTLEGRPGRRPTRRGSRVPAIDRPATACEIGCPPCYCVVVHGDSGRLRQVVSTLVRMPRSTRNHRQNHRHTGWP